MSNQSETNHKKSGQRGQSILYRLTSEQERLLSQLSNVEIEEELSEFTRLFEEGSNLSPELLMVYLTDEEKSRRINSLLHVYRIRPDVVSRISTNMRVMMSLQEMSITALAKKLHLHPSYVWRFMKEADLSFWPSSRILSMTRILNVRVGVLLFGDLAQVVKDAS